MRYARDAFFASRSFEAGHTEDNPTMHVKARAGSKARERVLSEAELVEVWTACRNDDFGVIVRLLILTGQRRAEMGSLQWPEAER